MKQKRTRHHVIPKSIGGCNCKANLKMIPKSEHEEYHKRYGNMHPWDVIILLERKLYQQHVKGGCCGGLGKEKPVSEDLEDAKQPRRVRGVGC